MLVGDAPKSARMSVEKSSRGEPMRILIVDDDELILRSLGRLLKRDFAVVTASCVADAFRELARATFDVILCDVRMPNVSGTSFVEKLSPLDAERVIFISGDAPAFWDATRPKPVCLQKPFTREELFDAIHDVCGFERRAS